MTVSATAAVPTAHASKYLQQLCKHWQHNLQVEFTPEHGTVTFPKDARGADWPGDGPRGAEGAGFLRRIRDGACRVFSMPMWVRPRSSRNWWSWRVMWWRRRVVLRW